MDIFTDINTGFQFCIDTERSDAIDILRNGIKDYNLIKWCEQFLTPKGKLIDIGSDIGTYSIILSKKCQEVYAFESGKKVFDCLNINLCMNNRFNVITHNVNLTCDNFNGLDQELNVPMKSLDSYQFDNIDFLRIAAGKNTFNVIKGAVVTLSSNNFPPFIFELYNDEWYRGITAEKINSVITYIEELGYKVQSISGVNNILLATSSYKTSSEHSINSELSIDELRKRYEMEQLQDNGAIKWDTWHALANYYRKLPSSQMQAYDCAIRGLRASPPIDKEYLLYEELSIVAFYINKKSEGYQACDNVILSQYAPLSVKNYTLNNQSFYMKRLPFKKIISMRYDLPYDYLESYSSLVPCESAESSQKFKLNLMAVNYSLNEKGDYIIKDSNNIVRNKSYLLTLDEELCTKGGVELIDASGSQLYPQNIRGFENVRLFGTNELFCTYREINMSHTHQICYCQYDPNTGHINKVIPLMVGSILKDEEDWIPFIMDNQVHFIYTIHPLRLYKLDSETGITTLVKEITLSDKMLNDFKGSGGLIPYKDGWLGTCHQTYYGEPDNIPRRKYFHRFIWFDKQFNIMKYSDIFYFESPDIEFNLSLCHSKNGLLVPFSQRENNSKIGILNYDILDFWLKL